MDTLHPWMERLSEYLDGDLAAGERGALEAHLAVCDECRATLEDLHAVVDLAGALEDQPPEQDLWRRIEPRITAGRSDPVVVDLAERRRGRTRRLSFTLPQLAAAAIALMLLSGTSVWLALSGVSPDASAVAAGATGPSTPISGTGAAQLVADAAEPGYDRAVADLERMLEAGRDRLDPKTIAVLEENLRIVDHAIEEARRAVEQDPKNVYLNNHLADSMRRKLQLLRQASSIVNVQT